MIQELGEPSRVYELVKLLRQAIQRGQWSAGAPLPTTRQLANKHRVSLVTVRAVLQRFEHQGLIERRPRRGSVVTARTPRPEGVKSMQQIAIIAGGEAVEPDNESWGDRIARAAEASVWGHRLQPAPFVTILPASRPLGNCWPESKAWDRRSWARSCSINRHFAKDRGSS